MFAYTKNVVLLPQPYLKPVSKSKLLCPDDKGYACGDYWDADELVILYLIGI